MCGRFENIWRLAWLPVWCVRGLGSTGVLFFWTAPVAFTQGVGLTFNIARVLVRAPIDEPGFEPTDTGGPHNAVKSVLSCPNVALSPPHVRHRRRTGLSSWARTCSRRWSFLLALPHLGAPVLIWTVHQQKYAKHKVQQLHVGKPCSRRETQRIFRALLDDLSAPMHGSAP